MEARRPGDADVQRAEASPPGRVAEALAVGDACAWWWEASSGRVTCTPSAAALFGSCPATLDELEGIAHQPDRAARGRERARAVARGGSWVVAFRLASADPDRWLEERGRAILDGEGRLAAMVALALDVSAHRGAETWLESIFASMMDGLVLYGADGRITQINPAAREMLGYGLEPGDGRDGEALLAEIRMTDVEGRPLPLDQLPIAAALHGESVRGFPLAFLRKDGRKVWATAGVAPIRAPDGAIDGAVLSLGDVSRLRDLQEQREDLSRMISHDLRAPLGVILGQAKLIGRRAEGIETLRARAEAIATSAQRMATMLNDLVESALLEAGKLRLERTPVDLAALLHDLRERLPTPSDAERIRLDLPVHVPRILGDPDRLERVFVNLLTNALKYSAPGTEVVVRIHPEDGAVVVEVEDRGQGIAPADVPHLFERYFRAAGTSHFEGMGLGLYTARMLAEAHGGTVEVSSVPGVGSVFRVRLPVRSRPG